MPLEPISDTPPITLAPRDDKARRRANAAPDTPIPFTADELEKGVALEVLLALPVPVYAYGTQITIHGTLPEMQVGMACGYKHLVRNANGSLGVRWGAIDGHKKQLLCSCLRWLGMDDRSATPWHAKTTSKGTTLSRVVASVKDGRAVLAALPGGIYGSASLLRCSFSGTIWADVEIGAIQQQELWNVIAHFAPGYDSQAVLDAREKAYQDKEDARQAARDTAIAAREAEYPAIRERIRQLAHEKGYRPVSSWKPQVGKWTRITKGSPAAGMPPKAITVTYEKRGPRVCRMVRELGSEKRKGKAISDSELLAMMEAARTGHLFLAPETPADLTPPPAAPAPERSPAPADDLPLLADL